MYSSYGLETWTLTWVDRVTNDEVLERMRKEKGVMNTNNRRALEYLGHLIRNDTRYKIFKSIFHEKCLERDALEEEGYHDSRT